MVEEMVEKEKKKEEEREGGGGTAEFYKGNQNHPMSKS